MRVGAPDCQTLSPIACRWGRGQGEGARTARRANFRRCSESHPAKGWRFAAGKVFPPHPSPLPPTVKLFGGEGAKHDAVEALCATTKKPAGAGFFGTTCCGNGSGDGLDVRGEAALVARGFVLVDQATAGVAVEHRLGGLVGCRGAGLVLGLDGLQHLADRRAQHRTLAGVAHAVGFSLAGALLGGLDVGHGVTPENGCGTKPPSIAALRIAVNPAMTGLRSPRFAA